MSKFSCCVVLIETVGNQSTIFQTNRLKDVIGASHLVYQVGTDFLFSAIGKVQNWKQPDKLDEYLLDPVRNPPIEQQGDDGVEIVVAASGKAILLMRSKKRARQIIGNITRKVHLEAAGVSALGAFVEVAEFDQDGSAAALNNALAAVHEEHARLRSALPGSDLRFQRLPFVEICNTSGLPVEDEFDGESLSLPVIARREARNEGWSRIRVALAAQDGRLPYFTHSVDQLEELGSSWVGIVHADGNGLGQVFLDFQNSVHASDARDYIGKLRNFSIAIDRCTRRAARSAIDAVLARNKKRARVIPVVLGGDDLTVICDGASAVRFSEVFLECFERETRSDEAVTCVEACKAGLTAAAGVAIVKPHFPFHRAYGLAADLCKSAKALKAQGSSLDYQVLFDTSGAQLEPIRERMTNDDGSAIHDRPYLVKAAPWKELRKTVEFLGRRATDETGTTFTPHLPRSQQHVLLQAAYRSEKALKELLSRLEQRYGTDVAREIGSGSILDAMELYDIEAQDFASTADTNIAFAGATNVE